MRAYYRLLESGRIQKNASFERRLVELPKWVVGDGQSSHLVLAKYTLYNNTIIVSIRHIDSALVELNMVFECRWFLRSSVELTMIVLHSPFTGKHDIYECVLP